jgi:hypothetical protein
MNDNKEYGSPITYTVGGPRPSININRPSFQNEVTTVGDAISTMEQEANEIFNRPTSTNIEESNYNEENTFKEEPTIPVEDF